MKICPTCRRSYPDDSLNYCLDDGAVLTWPANEREAETVLITPPSPTRDAQSLTTASPVAAPTTPFSMQAPPKKSRAWLWSILILGLLMLVCGGGAAGLLWRASLRKSDADIKVNDSTEKPVEKKLNSENSWKSDNDSESNSDSGSKLTMEKYSRIKDGMTYQEVVAILGSEGNALYDSSAAGVKSATYQWTGDNFEMIILTFTNGKLNSRTQVGLKNSNESENGSAVTREKYDRLTDGMSYKEVVQVLGDEGEEQFKSNIAGFNIATYQWKGSGFSSIIVTFQNDKLQSKSQVGL